MSSSTSPPTASSAPSAVAARQHDTAESFPSLSTPSSPTDHNPSATSATPENTIPNRSRDVSNASTLQGRLRSASKTFQESNPPTGMWIATGQIASSIPSLSDIRRGSFGSDGWSGEGQVRERARRASLTRRGSSQTSEDFLKRTNSTNPNSPRTTKPRQELRHQSVPENVEESAPQKLGVIFSGTPAGVPVGENTHLMAQSSAEIEMASLVEKKKQGYQRSSSDTILTANKSTAKDEASYRTTPFDNGYHFPPKHKWTESTVVGMVAFWKFFITPVGFLVTIYCLNVVAWGGMLFLLLCNAAPAMCRPTCNDINSPRKIWIEIDSQILNALFCVTGFGTIPWRFRDLYYLLQYRIGKNEVGLRRLAGINRGWLRLAGSQNLPIELGPANVENDGLSNIPESSVPFPLKRIPDAPLTGVRAPPTALWKLDFVIWAMVWNTFLQAVLSGFMWGLNRFDRPSWSTGLFVALACIVAAAGGIMSFIEGKKVKGIEGVPVSEKDEERLRRDRELGVTHYNNIKDEKPKEKKQNGKSKSKKDRNVAEAVQVDESALEEGVRQVVR